MSQEHTQHPSPAADMSRAPGHWRQALALATGLLLAGCSDGAGPAVQTTPEPTPQQKVAQLEASGQLPPLERLPLLGGMDANRDGVRDDIALHIEKTYSDPVQRRAAMQMARAYQAMLLVDKNERPGGPQCARPARCRTNPAGGFPCRKPAGRAGSQTGPGHFPAHSLPMRRCCLRRYPAEGKSAPHPQRDCAASGSGYRRERDWCWFRTPGRSR